MRAKYLILGVALLCLLVAPGTAFAADDGDKVDASVTTVLEAAGESPVPVIVYTQTGEEGVVDRVTPDGVETTVLDGVIHIIGGREHFAFVNIVDFNGL